MAGSKVTMPNLRKAHDVPVDGVVTKGADTCDIVRDKADSVDEEVLNYTSDVSATDEVESELLQEACRPRHSEGWGFGLDRYLCVAMAHSAHGTAEAVASSGIAMMT